MQDYEDLEERNEALEKELQQLQRAGKRVDRDRHLLTFLC